MRLYSIFIVDASQVQQTLTKVSQRKKLKNYCFKQFLNFLVLLSQVFLSKTKQI